LAQIFPEAANKAAVGLAAAASLGLVLAVGVVWYYFSPEYTDVGYRPVQPIPYSHRLHAGELGIDCRYCHASVETSAVAVVPPSRTCMNCHALVKKESPLLAPLRASLEFGQPLEWVRIHNLPDYAFFNHAAHVRAGVGCASCHGRIDTMEVVQQVEPLSMSWCLDCHRDPVPHLRPRDQVTNMKWVAPENQRELGREIVATLGLKPPTECSGCHR
jgi:hypothetical protein